MISATCPWSSRPFSLLYTETCQDPTDVPCPPCHCCAFGVEVYSKVLFCCAQIHAQKSLCFASCGFHRVAIYADRSFLPVRIS